MAAASRRPDPRLTEQLHAEAYRFDFFQAVRLLERLRPAGARVGRAGPPSREAVRFRSHVSLSFPASEIHELAAPAKEGAPSELTVAFMGLTGPLGVLPNHYTERLLRDLRAKDHVLHDFLDLFNHRLVSLFFRTVEKYRFPIAWESSRAREEGDDGFTAQIYALIGMGTPGLRGRISSDAALPYYAGLLAERPRCAAALRQILVDYFSVAVEVEQFTGEWLPLAKDAQSRLGGGPGANNQLGASAVLGERVWDQGAKFRLRVGPLTVAEYERFLPSGDALPKMVELVKLFVNDELEFDVLLVLRRADVTGIRLGDARAFAPRLGWSTWLSSGPLARDGADAVFEARSIPMRVQRSPSV